MRKSKATATATATVSKAITAAQKYAYSFQFRSTSTKSAKTALMPSGTEKPVPVATPKVMYAPNVWAEIEYFIEKQDLEVGWLGLVEKVGNDYLITEVFLPEQKVHSVETDISAEAMTKVAMEILDSGKCSSQLYYWGHSHVNMSVSPSTQDEEQIDEFLKSCPLFIRGIYNKKGHSKVDVYDVEQKCVFECVKNSPQPYVLSEDRQKSLDALMTKNVIIDEPVYDWRNTSPSNMYGGYDDYYTSTGGKPFVQNVVKRTTSLVQPAMQTTDKTTIGLDQKHHATNLFNKAIASCHQCSEDENASLSSFINLGHLNRAHIHALYLNGALTQVVAEDIIDYTLPFTDLEIRSTSHLCSLGLIDEDALADMLDSKRINESEFMSLYGFVQRTQL